MFWKFFNKSWFPGWWFGTWMDYFSISYMGESFPLTNPYFSRWLLHHQPDNHVYLVPHPMNPKQVISVISPVIGCYSWDWGCSIWTGAPGWILTWLSESWWWHAACRRDVSLRPRSRAGSLQQFADWMAHRNRWFTYQKWGFPWLC
jgi:hypothetical protein